MDDDIKRTSPAPHFRPQTFVAEPVPGHVAPSGQPPVTTPPAGTPTTPPKQPQQPKKRSAWREFLSFAFILIVAGLVAFLLITYVFRTYAVDGPSMESTLQNNDKLIIWKVPRTWARITGHQYIPKRGDIIVFNESNLGACGQQGTKQLVKRVIGLPGDRVVVKNNVYTIYNKQHPSGFNPDASLPYDSDNHIPPTSGNIDETLSSDELFVSGDNRPDSCDSRDFGPIQTNDVIGQLVLRILPVSSLKVF